MNNNINEILDKSFKLMGSDINAGSRQKLTKPTREIRRNILGEIDSFIEENSGLLETNDLIILDAKKYRGKWILLSETIHPKDYMSKYPNAFKFFRIIQSNEELKKHKSWRSEIGSLYSNLGDNPDNIVKISQLLAQNDPREFVTRLDSLHRAAERAGKSEEIMDIFIENTFDNKSLLDFLRYYEKLGSKGKKIHYGLRGQYKVPHKTLNSDVLDFVQSVTARKIIKNVIDSSRKKDLLGKKIWIDPMFEFIPVPKNLVYDRDAIPFNTIYLNSENKDVIRLYTKSYQDKEDEVFSDVFLCKSGHWAAATKYKSFVSDNLSRLTTTNCHYYWIDIDLVKAKEHGWEYLIFTQSNYKNRGFKGIYTTGFEFKDTVERKEFIEPIDTKNSYILSSKSTKSSVLWLVNIKDNTVVKIDTKLEGLPINKSNWQTSLIKYLTEKSFLNTYDILSAWYKSRGATIIVGEENDVDEIVVYHSKSSGANNDDVYSKVIDILKEKI